MCFSTLNFQNMLDLYDGSWREGKEELKAYVC